jgi:pantetheine-phosphate adenylyltransferase
LKGVIAIYPGSFDPPTNGHLDLIERGSKIFDKLVVSVVRNPEKEAPLFTVEERTEMLRALTHQWKNVVVDSFEGLLVDYAHRLGAQALLRGIRAISDYEYELQMALMNRKLEPQLETIFMLPAEKYSYLSSRLIKSVFQLGGSVGGLVPPLIEQKLHHKVNGDRRKPARKTGK